MQPKTILTIIVIIAAIGFIIISNLPISALAEPPEKSTTRGLSTADQAIHEKGPGLFSKGDVEFHTGTGQAGFCVSGVCPPR